MANKIVECVKRYRALKDVFLSGFEVVKEIIMSNLPYTKVSPINNATISLKAADNKISMTDQVTICFMVYR